MKKILCFVLCLILIVLCTTFFSYANENEGSDTDCTTVGDWLIAGDAYYDDTDNNFVLTENSTWQKGAIWYNYGYSEDFEIELDYYTGVSTSKLGGADGMVIAFYSDFNYSLGGGGDIGFSGCNGYGIELDTYRNSNNGDPNYNHIALVKNSVGNHLYETSLPESEDGKWHHIKVSVKDEIVSVFVDEVEKFSQQVTKSGAEWIGITSATGDGTNKHAVKNIFIKGERTNSIQSLFNITSDCLKVSDCLSDKNEKCEFLITADVKNNANATAPNVNANLILDPSMDIISSSNVSLGSIPYNVSENASWTVASEWADEPKSVEYQLNITI